MALVTGDMLVGGVLESGDMFDGAPVFSSPSIVNAHNWGPVQYQAVVTPSDAVVTLVAPVLGVSWNQGTKIATLTPAEPGSFQFTLRATKDGVSTDLTVSVVVDGRPVFFNPATLAVQAGAIAPVVIEAADPEGATLTLSALSVPNGLVFTPNPVPQNTGNGLVYTGTLSGSVIGGVHSATFRAIAANGGGQTDFTMTITASTVANQAPVVTPGGILSVVQGQSVQRNFSVSDPNGDVVAVSLQSAHSWITLSGSTVTAAPTDSVPPGTYQAVLSATDGQLVTNVTISVTVLPPAGPATGAQDVEFTTPARRTLIVGRIDRGRTRTFEQDPSERYDYLVDALRWLEGDELESVTWVVTPGVGFEDGSFNGGQARIWLTAGAAGSTYKVTCTMQTVGGRTHKAWFHVFFSVEDA